MAFVKIFGVNRVLIAEVRTDEEGKFTIVQLAGGGYELRVEVIGFSPFQRIIDVPVAASERLEVNLKLTPAEFEVTPPLELCTERMAVRHQLVLCGGLMSVTV